MGAGSVRKFGAGMSYAVWSRVARTSGPISGESYGTLVNGGQEIHSPLPTLAWATTNSWPRRA